jgi:hypothetical protein
VLYYVMQWFVDRRLAAIQAEEEADAAVRASHDQGDSDGFVVHPTHQGRHIVLRRSG